MLQKQNVPLQFRGGVDTKTDDKATLPTKLLVLENATFDNPGRLNKRNGYRALSRDIEGGGKLTEGRGVLAYKDELLVLDGRDLYSRSESTETWVRKGPLPTCRVSKTSVASASQTSVTPDAARHSSGMQAFVWRNPDGIRYSIIDSKTGQRIVASRMLVSGADVQFPRVISVGNTFVFYFVDADTNLRVGLLPVAEPTNTISFQTLVTYSAGSSDSLNATLPVYDVRVLSGGVCVVFANDDDGGSARLYSLSDPTSLLRTEALAVTGPVEALSVFEYDKGVAVAIAAHPGAVWPWPWTVEVQGLDWSLKPLWGKFLDSGSMGSNEPNPVRFITGASRSAERTDVCVFWTYTPAVGDRPSRAVTRWDRAAHDAFQESEDFLRSVSIAAQAFVVDGRVHVPLRYEASDKAHTPVPTATDRAYFVADEDRNIVAKALVGTGGVTYVPDMLSDNLTVPSTFHVDDGKVCFPALEEALTEGTEQVSGARFVPVFGVSAVELDLLGTDTPPSAEASGSLHVGSGIVWQYDGVGPVELGFHVRPPPPVTDTLPVGTFSYSYVVVPEWADAQGYKHFGTPSAPVAYRTNDAISKSDPHDLLVETIRLTAKQGARQPIVLGIYRTKNNDDVYRRVGEVENATDVDTIEFTDEMEDDDLEDQPVLYTTGGVLDHDAPPVTNVLAVHQGRVFAVDAENPLTIWYSNETSAGVPVEFSAFLTLPVDPAGGAITALASLDDKLVVFKGSRIYAITGFGPDALGQGGALSPATLVTSDAGCIDPRSVALSPGGLVFQSAKGVRLLDRSLTLVDIGRDVDGFKSERVLASVACASVNQIRLSLESGRALVFDYEASQWSVFTPMWATDAVLWRGVFCYLRADGSVLVEEPGRFDDAGSAFRVRLKTAWLQFAAMQGFQRVYRFLVLGSYKSAHKLRVRIAYDFNDTPSQVIDISPERPSTYGSGVYGSGVYGGEFPLYQWRVNPARQKCQAMQITLEDIPDETGESMSLNGLTFEVGVKRGTNKLGADRIVG